MTRKAFLAALLALALASCSERSDTEQAGFEELEVEHILLIVIDGSGSYRELLVGQDGQEGKAFKTVNNAIAAFLRGRENSKDRIIFAQISGKPPSLLFDGTPAAFQENFPDPASLKDFLLEKTDPRGSPVHHVICESLEYIISLHRQAPNTKSCVVIFSDFDDNAPRTDQTRDQMANAFKEYAKVAQGRGAVGAYWVDLAFVPGLTRTLREAGLRPDKFVVESGINVAPRLPLFD